MHRYHEDTLVLVASSKSNQWKNYKDIITGTKIMSSIIICVGDLQQQRFEELSLSFQKVPDNSFFYWIGVEGKSLNIIDWKKIMSMKNNNKIIANSIEFDTSGRVVFDKDMQGIHINCSTLSWAPYFKLNECKSQNKTNCKGIGYLADVMNILGKRFNFTWSCDAESTGNWGHAEPISGPRNVNGSWGGVFGLVTNGTYPLSISAWTYFEWRRDMFDFASMGTGAKYVVAYLPKSSKFDLWLFTKPFSFASWIVIGFILLLIKSIIFLGRSFETYFNHRCQVQIKLTGIHMVVIIGWTFLIIILNGFYDGALTMFFAKENVVHFESEIDLLESYPDWTYNLRKGLITHIVNKAEGGNVLYQKKLKLIEESPSKFLVNSIAEGIRRMKSGQVAVHIGEKGLRQFYTQNPTEPLPNTFVSSNDGNTENFIFTKNSPLLPFFAIGSLELFETGVMKSLEKKWMGEKLNSKISEPLHTVVLDVGQLAMVFLMLGASIIISFIIVGIELLWDRILTSRKGKTAQNSNPLYRMKLIKV